jgi:hypothetical protein
LCCVCDAWCSSAEEALQPTSPWGRCPAQRQSLRLVHLSHPPGCRSRPWARTHCCPRTACPVTDTVTKHWSVLACALCHHMCATMRGSSAAIHSRCSQGTVSGCAYSLVMCCDTNTRSAVCCLTVCPMPHSLGVSGASMAVMSRIPKACALHSQNAITSYMCNCMCMSVHHASPRPCPVAPCTGGVRVHQHHPPLPQVECGRCLLLPPPSALASLQATLCWRRRRSCHPGVAVQTAAVVIQPTQFIGWG